MMQITLNIPDNAPQELVQQVINELAGKLRLQIDLISTKPFVMETDVNLEKKLANWQHSFKQTQNLPNIRTITDEDIENEIDAYRLEG